MPLFAINNEKVARLPETSFQALSVKEREHLQKWLRDDIAVLGENLIVIAEEFSQWEESSRRIDLLCLDDEGCIVVVELKRTEDGGHMELQALRYAAMVSAMTLDQLIGAHARLLGGPEHYQSAEAAVLAFLGFESTQAASLPGKVRLILVSQNFSREITTSVLWLNSSGLDIKCIRLTPYRLADGILLDVQAIIPLPEAADYEMKIKAQKDENDRAEIARHALRRRFWTSLIPLTVAATGAFANRTAPSVNWLLFNLRPGIRIGFVVLKDTSRAEIYIDHGVGSDNATRATFDFLVSRRTQIESDFGGSLNWDSIEQSRACRISCDFDFGWISPEADWPVAQQQMARTLGRLKGAIEPHLSGLRSS